MNPSKRKVLLDVAKRPSAFASPDLFGRKKQLDALSDLLDRADAGRGGSLLLTGVAGVGKTALLTTARETAEARGFSVRSATGVPIDSALPFGALSTLFGRERGDEQFVAHSPALGAAIGMTPVPEPPSVPLVAAEALRALSEQGRERPTLLILDDAQWADYSSAAVLGLVARNVVADRIAIVIAARTMGESFDMPTDDSETAVGVLDQTQLAFFDGIVTHLVRPLSNIDTIAALVAAGCSSDDASWWSIRCGGLPLAISEIGRRSPSAPPDPREIAAFLPSMYRQRIAALSQAQFRALLFPAICSDLAVLRSLDEPGLTSELTAAQEAGLLQPSSPRRVEDRVMFRHPLLQAAVLARATPVEEREVHRRVAVVLRERGQLDRAALHLASAANGQDDEAAAAMGDLAERARARGALAEAAQAGNRAASLTTDPDRRAVWLTLVADALFDQGHPGPAIRTVTEAIEAAEDSRVKADAQALKARMSMWVVSPAVAIRMLDDVAATMRSVDPIRAASALASASGAGHLDGDLFGAIARAVEADRLASDNGDIITAMAASGAMAWNSLLTGDASEFERRVSAAEPLMRQLLDQRSWAGIHLAELFCTTWILH